MCARARARLRFFFVFFFGSKVVPVMILGTLLLRRQYGVGDYIAALMLVSGIILFSLGDSEAQAEARVRRRITPPAPPLGRVGPPI